MHRFNLKGRFAPAAIAAAAAIAVAGTGSAVAGHLLTGSDIQNSSLKGIDIKNRSLTGSDLKKETLSASHLKPAARAALKGQQGPMGPQGPKGDKGDKGDTGAPGQNGTAKAYGTMAADGTLTRAHGITKGTKAQGFASTYCFEADGEILNAVATSLGGQGNLFPSIDYGRGTGNVCPEGTDLTIRTTNSAGQLTDAAFSFLAQ